MTVTLWLLGILAWILAYMYLNMKGRFRYWKDKGVVTPEPVAVFGNTIEVTKMKLTLGELLKKFYSDYPEEKLIGYYDFTKPVLLVRDLDLVERVLVKDFANFGDRTTSVDEKRNPLEVSLFNLKGSKWKAVRNKMTPTFTTGKLKGMVPQMVDSFRNTDRYLREECKGDVDLKDVCAMYATDVIGSCVFGLDLEELAKPGSEFRRMGTRLFKLDWQILLKILCMRFAPPLAKLFRPGFNPTDVLEYYEMIAKQALEARRRNGQQRQDFVQLLLQLSDKGTVEFHSKELTPDDDYLGAEHLQTTEKFQMTEKLIVSQAISFLTAGFEGIGSTMTFFCYEVATHPEIQEKLRADIGETLERHGTFSYEAIKDMSYLDQCLQETLRMYPIAQNLFRSTRKTTTLDGVKIPAETSVMIPIMGIHYDPAYFPEPNKFDPDRFHHDATRSPFSFIPFGDGPRMCIGMRFALLEMKIGLAMLLKNFILKLSPKTKLPLEYSPTNFALTSKHKILFELTKI